MSAQKAGRSPGDLLRQFAERDAADAGREAKRAELDANRAALMADRGLSPAGEEAGAGTEADAQAPGRPAAAADPAADGTGDIDAPAAPVEDLRPAAESGRPGLLAPWPDRAEEPRFLRGAIGAQLHAIANRRGGPDLPSCRRYVVEVYESMGLRSTKAGVPAPATLVL